MNYKNLTLTEWIEKLNGAIEDERSLDGNEMRDLKAFLSELPRWLPVIEKLPNLMQDVLVSDGTDTFIGWYNTELKRWVSSSTLYNSKEYPIKAWMPLPEPYKGSDNLCDTNPFGDSRFGG